MQFNLMISPIQSRFIRGSEQHYINDIKDFARSMAAGQQI